MYKSIMFIVVSMLPVSIFAMDNMLDIKPLLSSAPVAAEISSPVIKSTEVVVVTDHKVPNLVVLPKDEAAEKAFTEKVNVILSSAKSKEGATKINPWRLIKKSDVHLGIILGVTGFNSWNTSGQPVGFATESSNQTGMNYELGFQVKFKQFGLEWLPFDDHYALSTKFYGASLGDIRVTRTSLVIGKFYPVEKPNYVLSVGLGAEHTKLDNHVMLGGMKFPAKGDGWSPVFQVGGQYHLNKCLSLEGDYMRHNVRITSEIPGVPDLVSGLESSYSFRLVWWPF